MTQYARELAEVMHFHTAFEGAARAIGSILTARIVPVSADETKEDDRAPDEDVTHDCACQNNIVS